MYFPKLKLSKHIQLQNESNPQGAEHRNICSKKREFEIEGTEYRNILKRYKKHKKRYHKYSNRFRCAAPLAMCRSL